MRFQVIELSMLEQGQEFELTRVNGDYEARLSLTSRYYRRRINVYSQGNGEMGVFVGISRPVALPWYQNCNCKHLLLQKHGCNCQHRFAGANLHFRATTEKSTLQPQNRLSHFCFKTHSKFSDHEKKKKTWAIKTSIIFICCYNCLSLQNMEVVVMLWRLFCCSKSAVMFAAAKANLLLQWQSVSVTLFIICVLFSMKTWVETGFYYNTDLKKKNHHLSEHGYWLALFTTSSSTRFFIIRQNMDTDWLCSQHHHPPDFSSSVRAWILTGFVHNIIIHRIFHHPPEHEYWLALFTTLPTTKLIIQIVYHPSSIHLW